MRGRRLALVLVLAILGGVTADTASAQVKPEARVPKGAEVDLRPRFTKGQEVRLKMTLDSKGMGAAEGEDGGTSTKQEIGLLLRCTGVDPEKGYTLDLVYESFKATIRNGVADVEFDSTKPATPDDPFDAVLRSLVGLTQTVVMDKHGEITSVSGGEALRGLAGGLGASFGAADVFKSIFGPITTTKKGQGKASVGESWTTQSSLEGLMGTTRIEMTHTIASSSGGRATITSVGKVLLDPSSGQGTMPPVRISDSTITGKTVWDLEGGMLVESDSRQRLSVQVRRDGKAENTTQEMNVKVTRVK
ncbi:MAG: hypothetical protein HBSAPP03_05440 [Phycisphaerae bacterium]|nr:MAG: hypothetical protein HBSAPP03_05440 [Phycisphaerae bacterium]